MSLRVIDEAGREDTSTIYFVVEDGQARIPDYDKENPAWMETAVVYGVVPFLFGSPAFQAVADRLDELADLGINAIWLGPINLHPADDYGYAVEDYFSLDPAYGTAEDFRNLQRRCRTRRRRARTRRKALVVGGDCTIELGSVAGALQSGASIGLVYVDLDVDLNAPATSDGALDWTGVAHLLDIPGAAPELSGLGRSGRC